MRKRKKEPQIVTTHFLTVLLTAAFTLAEGVVGFLAQASKGPRTCIVLAQAEITALRQFFVLLNQWDQECSTGRKQ